MNTVIKSFFVSLVILALSISAYAVDQKSILLYYPCDEGSGQVIKDASGNKRDAEWRKGVATRSDGKWTEGKFGKALSFDGTQCGCYETKNDPALDQALGSAPFTVAYYVKTTVKTGKGRTVDKGSHGCNNGWHSAVTNGNIIFEAAQGGGCIAHTDNLVADGNWHHVAHSMEPGIVGRTYIDGVQNKPDFTAMATKKSISSNLGRPLALGVSFEFNTEFLTAQLDEIALFNYAMSKDEINALMPAPLTAVELTGKLPATWGDIKNRY